MIRKARGKRLKLVRQLTGLTRQQIEKKYNISANTLQSWEVAKKGGLTMLGAKRMLTVIEAEGIRCSMEWLMHGTGSPPQITDRRYLESYGTDTKHQLSEQEVIAEELLSFCTTYPETLHMVVADDAMEPHYYVGDQVAGKTYPSSLLHLLAGRECIVQTGNQTMLRHLRKNTQDNLYDLVCLNPKTDCSPLLAQTIINAAPVSWHRQPSRLSREHKKSQVLKL